MREEINMYARLVWGRLKPGAWEGYERFFREKTVPLTQGTKGLLQRYLLHDIDSDEEGLSFSWWETAEDMENYEHSDLRKSLAEETQENYATSWSYVRGEYWVKTFEVKNVTRYDQGRRTNH
jgi:heme-degrading monooxygenase HmoA